MTQKNKPEWFEIIDKDEKPELRKVSKSIPVTAVLAVALILGVGAVVGQTQNETPASASSETLSQSPQVTENPTTAAAVVVGAVAANKLVNPSIAMLPTGGGDDEEGDDEEEGDYDEGDDD